MAVDRNGPISLACLLGCWAAAAGLADTCRADNGATTCGTCHPQRADEFARSVHKGISCQQCHGGGETYALGEDALAVYVNQAAGARPAFDHGTSFSGKPARSEVPNTCGECHADVERMNPYGLRTDQLSRYWTSGHGKTLKSTGDERVAVCVDCHDSHYVLPAEEPESRTHVLNVPDTCARCHAVPELMAEFDLPIEVVSEYRDSVHGKLLFEHGDTGAPTCATCHGNHSAMPPGFAAVGAVCGQCHQHAAATFATSVHAGEEDHKGCVQCHGGGEGRAFHLIERITKAPTVMTALYARLMDSENPPTPEQIHDRIHPEVDDIMARVLPTCLECHEDPEDDESLPKLFARLDEIGNAELSFAQTATRLDEVGQGILLVDNQRFRFEDARTLLIELAPLQHSLADTTITDKIAELHAVCDEVNTELDKLEAGLKWRYRALAPIWIFAILFSVVLYAKYKQLKRAWVKPMPRNPGQ